MSSWSDWQILLNTTSHQSSQASSPTISKTLALPYNRRQSPGSILGHFSLYSSRLWESFWLWRWANFLIELFNLSFSPWSKWWPAGSWLANWHFGSWLSSLAEQSLTVLLSGRLSLPGLQQGLRHNGLRPRALLRPPPRHPRLLLRPLLRPGQTEHIHLHRAQVTFFLTGINRYLDVNPIIVSYYLQWLYLENMVIIELPSNCPREPCIVNENLHWGTFI